MLHILIATGGRPQLLERTLASLERCDALPLLDQTLIVENGTRAGTENVVRRTSPALRAKYRFHPVANKSAALNATLGELHDGLVAFLDDDVLVSEGWLRAYAAGTSAIPRGVFFGGPVHAEYEEPPPSWLVPYLPASAKGWSLGPNETVVTAPIFLGGNWAAFVRDLRDVGGFDPWVGPGSQTGSTGEEKAMQLRLLGAGAQGRYLPDAEVWHWVPKERCSPRWALRRAYRNGIKYGFEARLPTETARVWGYPRYAIRRAAESTFRVLARSAARHEEARFQAQHEWLVAVGFLRGNRLAHQRARTETSAPCARAERDGRRAGP